MNQRLEEKKRLRVLRKGLDLEPAFHTPGAQNAADLDRIIREVGVQRDQAVAF